MAQQLTTVFVRQGHYALDPEIVSAYPAADWIIDRIGDLVSTAKRARRVPFLFPFQSQRTSRGSLCWDYPFSIR